MTYAADLRAAFLAEADPAEAMAMARYMRDQFPFFGLKKGPREAIQKQFFKDRGLPSAEAVGDVVRELWRCPERECHYAGLAILSKMVRRKNTALVPSEIMPVLDKLITHKSWWDTVDLIASRLVGWALREDLQLRSDTIGRWRGSDDFWLRRSAILFQLKYKDATDSTLLFSLCADQLGDTEFFIRKAIGWALREYSKTDRTAVVAFVDEHPEMSGLSRREALKWLQSHPETSH